MNRFKKYIYFVLKIYIFLSIINVYNAKVLMSDEKNESNYIFINKDNINDFIGIKENKYLLNILCKSVLTVFNIKEYFLEKLRNSFDILSDFQSKNINTDNLEEVEKILHNSLSKENEEFLLATKKLIGQYKEEDLFILQIGLNSLTPFIFNKIENITFVEEDIDVCKNFFRNKFNRCLFTYKGIEVYCKNGVNRNKNNDNPIFETLNMITKINKEKNKNLIDILIINYKYPVAILYYVFPYLDPSTLVILMNNLNYKMKNVIFQYYNFLGETYFFKHVSKDLNVNKQKIKETEKENLKKNDELNKKYAYNQILDLPLCVITLKPKTMLNPSEDSYKVFISNEYSSLMDDPLKENFLRKDSLKDAKIPLLVDNVEEILKSYKNLYEKNKVEISNYFTFIKNFDISINNEDVEKNISNSLLSIIYFEKHTELKQENFEDAFLKIKKIFDLMLLYVYENSEFKIFFTPLIDYFKLNLNQNDIHYISYKFLIYELIVDSFDISSYELKELLFIDILRDISKRLNELNIDDIINILIKLNIILKKIKSRENIQYIKNFAEKEFNVDYKNYDL